MSERMTERVLLTEEENGGAAVALRPERSDNNTRLDKYVAANLPDLSRSYVQQLIDDGRVLVDGQQRRAAFKLTVGEVITVEIPPVEPVELIAEPMPLVILYEDSDLIVLDKPAGLVVHPAPGHPTGTLVNGLLAHAPEISIAGTNRPGIVHRLDKDTSGLMVVAKSDRAHQALIEQWQSGGVHKEYVALAYGMVETDEGTIDAPMGRDPQQRKRMAVVREGKSAVSHFTVEQRFASSTLLRVKIDTGRTHQIRVHLAFIGHPVVGDEVYAGSRGATRLARELGVGRQFLHASRLAFTLPGGARMEFDAPLPRDLREPLLRLTAEALMPDRREQDDQPS